METTDQKLEQERYLEFKFLSLSQTPIKNIPTRELALLKSEIESYIENRNSVIVTAPQEQTVEKTGGIRIVNAFESRLRSEPAKRLYRYLTTNLTFYGQSLYVTTETLGLNASEKEKLWKTVTHLTNPIYRKTFPDARLSYCTPRDDSDPGMTVTIFRKEVNEIKAPSFTF